MVSWKLSPPMAKLIIMKNKWKGTIRAKKNSECLQTKRTNKKTEIGNVCLVWNEELNFKTRDILKPYKSWQ